MSTWVDDPKRVVAEGYDRIAEAHRDWAGRTRTEERRRYATVLLDALPAGAEVLELGCGTGRPTTALLASRLRVTGVDISERSIELARASVPAARFVAGDMTRVEFAAESFDAVAAFYSIIHVPRDEHAALFRAAARWLRPGGLLVASLGTSGAAAGFEEDWLGAPMFWSGHDAATARRLVTDAGLEILRATEEVADEDGHPVAFLWIVAQKRVG